MKNSFFALVFRQRYIKRWGLMRNVFDENLAEHSAQTAMIAHALAVISVKRLGKNVNPDAVTTAALYHDASEIYTGDMPTPIKYYNDEIHENYKQIENTAISQLVAGLPDDLAPDYRKILDIPDPEIHRLVKAADKLCAYIKCVEEIKCGNREFADAGASIRKSLDDMNCPELDIFMSEFLPPFGSTLDGLNGKS